LLHIWESSPTWDEDAEKQDFDNMKSTQYTTIYTQFDGYPEGVGVGLAEFIL